MRRKRHEEHENHERWLVSYADFITLLFAFFVVMYSISSVNEGKYKVLSDTLVGAFNQPQRSVDPIQIGSELPRGIRWIRSHPLTPYAMCVFDTPLDTDKYQQVGLGPVMIWKTKKNIVEPVIKAGLPWHAHMRVGRQGRPRLNEELKEKWRQRFAQDPGAQGILVNDEVKGEEPLRIAREAMDWLLFTLTRRPLSQRLLLSSCLSVPVDTWVFLFCADRLNPSSMSLMILGKMIGVWVLWLSWRHRNQRQTA